jgi:hypothetical protein
MHLRPMLARARFPRLMVTGRHWRSGVALPPDDGAGETDRPGPDRTSQSTKAEEYGRG